MSEYALRADVASAKAIVIDGEEFDTEASDATLLEDGSAFLLNLRNASGLPLTATPRIYNLLASVDVAVANIDSETIIGEEGYDLVTEGAELLLTNIAVSAAYRLNAER